MADTRSSGQATQPQKSRRETFMGKMRERYPDKNFDDEEELYGQLDSDYDDYDKQLSGYRDREQKLSDMFVSDPRSARLMTGWRDGEDPAIALVRLYGQDILDAVGDPEKQKALEEANKEYAERVAKSKELDAAYPKNLEASLATLQQVQAEMGLSDEEIDSAMEWLVTILKDFMQGKFSAETIRMAINAQNHDRDVEAASQEGLVQGRNAKIEEQRRKARKGDGIGNLGGGSAPVQEEGKNKRRGIFGIADAAK